MLYPTELPSRLLLYFDRFGPLCQIIKHKNDQSRSDAAFQNSSRFKLSGHQPPLAILNPGSLVKERVQKGAVMTDGDQSSRAVA